ncbi:MAG TPA: HAD family hydrolase [Acidimicrobiales bacterium]|nr:HAD family hydrolase [Acidimicrobiales bacterium]
MGLALFDLDNTLLDREAAFTRWSQGFMRHHGLPQNALPFLESADQDGLTPRRIFFEQVRAEFDVSSSVEELVVRYYQDYPACYTVDAETVGGLRQLRAKGWCVAVITNGGIAQMAKLERTKLTQEVDAICVSEIIGAAKPDPAIFEMAAQLCEHPLVGWMTGDSAAADIAGGRGVGLRTIWIARGRTWKSPSPSPDAIVDTVPQAVRIILEAGAN